MKNAECNGNCWIAAGIAGVLVLLFTWGVGDLSFFAGLFLGVIATLLLGALLVWLACSDRPELFGDADSQTVTDWAREAADSQPGSLLVSGSLGPEPALMTPPIPIVAGAMSPTRDAVQATPEAPAKAKAKAKAPVETSAETSAETGTEAGAKPKAATRKPKADAAPDDLKRIKGIGPKLSEWLHENGVTRYAQIAEWDRAAIADYAERLGRMGGRIEADDWVGQAKLLAAGGETEFSHRVDDGEVY